MKNVGDYETKQQKHCKKKFKKCQEKLEDIMKKTKSDYNKLLVIHTKDYLKKKK